MQHYAQLQQIPSGESWLTIGAFDGVHRGHQFLISQVVASAHGAGAKAYVMTFEPHPAIVLRGMKEPYYITTHEDKLEYLSRMKLDGVITLEFTQELSELSAREFMGKVAESCHLKYLLVGKDFALGKGRVGTYEYLARLGKELGYEMCSVSDFKIDGEKVSSTLIRESLRQGDIPRVNRLLGRKYAVSGEVVEGEGRGYHLGFPTANIQTAPFILLPEGGVYVCQVELDGKKHKAVTNIGLRPTFNEGETNPRVEVHILDYAGNLYHRNLRVEFIQRLRAEKKFNSVEELKNQVQSDIRRAREETG